MPGSSAGSSGSWAKGSEASTGSSGCSAGTGTGTPAPIAVSRACTDAAYPLPVPSARSATSTAGPRQSMPTTVSAARLVWSIAISGCARGEVRSTIGR